MLKFDYVWKQRNSKICRKHRGMLFSGVISAEILWIRRKKRNALKMVTVRSLDGILCKSTNGR
jgi:hypothetical protein